MHNTDPQEPKTICHVFFPETTVLPGQTEVELPLSLTTSTDHGTALLEPASAFMQKYGVLIARSLTLAGTGTTMVRMLNPSAPVTIYQNEKAGELHPITGESVCTIQQTKPRNVLIARSLTFAGTGITMVCMLNPSSPPVTIYQIEKAGKLHPITGESVCTIQQTKPRKQCRDPALIEKAVELLLPNSPEQWHI